MWLYVKVFRAERPQKPGINRCIPMTARGRRYQFCQSLPCFLSQPLGFTSKLFSPQPNPVGTVSREQVAGEIEA